MKLSVKSPDAMLRCFDDEMRGRMVYFNDLKERLKGSLKASQRGEDEGRLCENIEAEG